MMAESQPTSSHLLAMPGEVRNHIYELLLVLAHPVCIYRKVGFSVNDTWNKRDDLASTLLLPLFLTCRQLHLEASAVFYSRNGFVLPRNASSLPRSVQTNLLFRHFLDRIGPRNAALLRHLAIPFPVDPHAFVGVHRPSSAQPLSLSRSLSQSPQTQPHNVDDPAKEEATQPAEQEEEDQDQEQSQEQLEETQPAWPTSLLPALALRCPNLETVRLACDLRHDARWLALLSPHAAAARARFARLDAALRGALPRLRGVRVVLAGAGRLFQDRDWEVVMFGDVGSRDVTGFGWIGAVVRVLGMGEGGLGWNVAVMVPPRGWSGGAEAGDYDRRDGGVVGAAAFAWDEPTPVDASRVLYGPPKMMLRSEIHDQWTRLEVLQFRLYYARRWLSSPARAAKEKEEANEWREWRRGMLERARTASLAMDCAGGGPRMSRRKRALSRVASFL